MKTCRNCGAELANTVRFCHECGQDQSVAVPQDQRIQTENIPVPPPPQQGSWVGRGFGGGFGASIGWVLGSCVAVTVLSVLLFVGCAALVAVGSNP